jgi:acetyl esterase/lipase
MARYLAAELPRTAIRRLRNGPLVPGWGFRFEAFVAAMRVYSARAAAGSLSDERRYWEALAAAPDAIQRRVRRSSVQARGVPCDWFEPRDVSPSAPVVLYFHGGGYVFGSPATHRHLVANLAVRARARLLVPAYRLAPEHPMPAAIDDSVAVARWLIDEARVPARRVVVAGDSAGGGLSVATMVALRDAGDPLPAGAALLCPWCDLSDFGGSMITNEHTDWVHRDRARVWAAAYLGEADPRDPRASVRYAKLSGLPPMLVQGGAVECLRDQIVLFAQEAQSQGVDARLRLYDAMVHDWHSFVGMFPELGVAIDEIAAFVRERTR